MVNRHSFYNKKISRSRQLFQKTDMAREVAYLRTIDRKLTLNLIVTFNSFTDISSLKYVAKTFVSLTNFRKTFGSISRCGSPWLCLCIFYQVKKLVSCKYCIKGLWEKSKETVLLKVRSLNVFPAIFFWKFTDSQHNS